jgi:uncharacterized protein (DUF302 family)
LKPNVSKTVKVDFDEALRQVRQELGANGFGVLTEIDVQSTLNEKIGADFTRYVILGACVPALAHRALCAAPEVGVFLPCNVIVRETGESQCRIDAINARAMSEMLPGSDELEDVADEVARRLDQVLKGVG